VTTAPPPDAGRERAYGLLLFDAEESLARGEAEKAMVLASRAVKERPESLTARALVERARSELTRGKRREKLEARISQAERLFESGDFAAAEKIVTSALKFVPDHAAALALFAKLRDRPRAGAAEAEADRELAVLARAQAQKALEAARAARASGWDRRALVHLRRGLRQVPDHPELLALLREAQGAVEGVEAERSRRRALHAQVRAGLELLANGLSQESLRTLRAVLLEDPDNARAQAAIQEVRRALVGRAAQQRGPEPASEVGAARPTSERPLQRPAPAPAPPPDLVADRSLPFVPVEILLPRTRRHRTPVTWVVAGAAFVLGAVALVSLSGRTSPGPMPPAPPPVPASQAPEATLAPPESRLPGPLANVDPDLRRALEATLKAYAGALEHADAAALAAARHDLSPAAREARLGPFAGALNAATDVRVLDVVVTGDRALVTILCTDVIIGGKGAPQATHEETLRFQRRQGAWTLGPAGR
jgi:tetratricopeptide (TPR) repeat protein